MSPAEAGIRLGQCKKNGRICRCSESLGCGISVGWLKKDIIQERFKV